MNGKQINPIFQRLALLVGADALNALESSHAFIFGLGGVGSWCAEGLVRSGMGSISIIDYDTVAVSNINRQVQATNSTRGEFKAEALKRRLLDINPACNVTVFNEKFSKENAGLFGLDRADFVIDAIDSLENKLDLIEITASYDIKLFSSMGMARKLNPTMIQIADIWNTHGCPLARLVRSGLRKRGFSGNFLTVFSPELITEQYDLGFLWGSAKCSCDTEYNYYEDEEKQKSSKKIINGSAVAVTACAGMTLASLVIGSVCEQKN